MRPNIIPSIFTAIDQLSGPVRRMGMTMRGFALTSEVGLARMQRSFAATSTAAMGIATSGAAMAAALIIPLALATKAAVDFEGEMSNISTLVDTNVESMDDMSNAVLRLAKKVPKSLADLTESLYQIRSAGVSAADAMNVLEVSTKLSVAGLSTATESTKAVTSAMNSFKRQGLTAEQIANSFFLTVKEGKTKMDALNESFGDVGLIIANAGVSLQEFNAATAAMTNAGMSASIAQVALRGAIIALQKPSGEMVDILEQMGYTGADAGLKLIAASGGAVNAMMAIKDAATKSGDNINKAFGRVQGLNALIALTGIQREQYKEFYKEQMQGADALNTAYGKQLVQGKARIQLFKNSIQELGIKIGGLLVPALNRMINILTPIIDGIADFAANHKVLVGTLVDGVAILGLAAATTAAVGLAVGTVTKAYGLWKLAIVSVNFLMGVNAVRMGTFNMVMLKTPAYIQGATFAMNGFGAATKLAFAELLIGYGVYKMVMNEMERQKNEKNMNPLGLDYYGEANDKGNKKIREKYGISADQFEKDKKYYNYQRDKDLKPGQYYNMFGGKVRGLWGGKKGPGDISNMGGNMVPAIDSTNFKSYQSIENQQKSDSTFQKTLGYEPVPYTPRSAQQNITLTIENNTGLAANVSKDGNTNSANEVKIKLRSTTSRPKSATA